jgi:hypothetical protein
MPVRAAVVIGCCPWPALLAQDAPKYSNEFLAIGVGARALGMGSPTPAL